MLSLHSVRPYHKYENRFNCLWEDPTPISSGCKTESGIRPLPAHREGKIAVINNNIGLK